MKAIGWVLALVVAWRATPARADSSDVTFLGGPVFGIAFGDGHRRSMLFGLEGGAGYHGPERLNVGIEHRVGKSFLYVEADPWLLVGGSFGVGVDSDGVVNGIVGVWEGAPLVGLSDLCQQDNDFHTVVTIAAGYRWTGVHELYVSLKGGVGNVCLPNVIH